MSLDPQLLRQLHETFRGELDDQLRVITDGLLALEAGARPRCEHEQVLNSVFRAAHNIKGAARSVDLRDIADIAHHLESLFSALRSQGSMPDGDIVDLSLETLDRMRDAMTASQEERPLPFEMADLFVKLGAATDRLEPDTKPGPRANAGVLAAARIDGTPEAASPTPHPHDDACEEAAPEPATPPAASSRTASPTMESRAPRPEQIRVSTDKLQAVAALAEELQIAKIELDDRLARFQRLDVKLRELASTWRRTRSQLQGGLGAELPLDLRQLLDATGEQVADAEERATRLSKAMRTSTNRIGVVSSALQSDIRLLRLVPVATLLRPMTRTVREIGREQGKRVELRIADDHVEMDRMVLDGVRDPLLHLLRNAIDHGLETPEERRGGGKPETGVLSIDVGREGSHVVIKVSDDGRGIDSENVRRVAEKKQIASANELERSSGQDLLDLLFQPGFSTRESVTELSGRGIGLDVVRSNIQALYGGVELQSEPGVGTTFVLRLPVTLSTERGLQVRVGRESLVIPSVAVDRILDVCADAIMNAQGEAVIVVDGSAVALRDLAQLLALESPPPGDRHQISVVVVNRGGFRVALIVDDVVGEREIVVKRLLPPLEAVPNVTGATLTGDGSVMVVLDPTQLIDAAHRCTRVAAPAMLGAEDEAATRILVVDDSITTRTLERNILEGHGYDVTVASDGEEAWETMQRDRFDLVVTDIEMPRMSGFELTERIKHSEALAGLPVIIVSSLAQENEMRRGMEAGADAYLTKGMFETGKLLDAVSQLV